MIFVSAEIIAGERQAEELGASLAAEMMFYAVASAVLANEVDTIMELSLSTQFLLLEILKSTFLSDIEAQAERAGGGRTLRNRKGRDAGPGSYSNF